MGIRGPSTQKVPTRVQQIRGNPSHRPLNKQEPKPEEGRPPETPKILEGDEAAKAEYDDLITLTEGMRILTVADGAALGKLAYLEARFREMAEGVRKTGLLVQNKKTGMVHINPLLKQMKEFIPDIWRGYREFGFTPASRASLKTHDTPKEDDWSEL